MIIWTRWGILSLLGVGLGVGIAFAVGSPFGLRDGPFFGALVLVSGALVNFLLARFVYPRLDKPVPVTITRPFTQPRVLPDGRTQTQETVYAVDPEGQPVWQHRRSTLFFIPASAIWVVLMGLAVIVAAVGLVQVVIG